MNIPYKLAKPCKTIRLNKTINEISGIHALNKNTLLCVEDEHLNIYAFNLDKEKMGFEYASGMKGDAEDIVIIGNTAYILSAAQRAIYVYKKYQSSMDNVDKIKLDLKMEHDPEGMCYCKTSGYLLIACKGDPKPKSNKRLVFAFDMHKKKLIKKPYFKLDASKLRAYQSGKTFNPSGIAIHPKSKEIYLIGTRSLKLILRLDPTGSKILGEKQLKKSIYKQPEGITFLENGDLVLACEAKNKSKAKIFVLSEVAL